MLNFGPIIRVRWANSKVNLRVLTVASLRKIHILQDQVVEVFTIGLATNLLIKSKHILEKYNA